MTRYTFSGNWVIRISNGDSQFYRNMAVLKILSFVALLCLLTKVEAQDPEIAEVILPEIKRQGLSGSLRCVVINQLNNPVHWLRDRGNLHITTDGKIVVDEKHNEVIDGRPKYEIEREFEGEKNIYTITVHRLDTRDSGFYTCQILVRGTNEVPSKKGQLVVLVPPSIVTSTATKVITVREGDSFNLTCNADGYPRPNVTWVRISGQVLPDGRLRHEGTLFPVKNVMMTDRGIYRCLADNAVRPPAVFDTVVEVYFRPRAIPVQTSYGQAENRMFDVTIECRVAGWPDPDLQWYKENFMTPIQDNDKYTVNILLNHANILAHHERWLQLVIRTVTANDYGNYLCAGTNVYGMHYTTIKLFATSECQGPNCPEEQVPGGRDSSSLARSTGSIILAALVLAFMANKFY